MQLLLLFGRLMSSSSIASSGGVDGTAVMMHHCMLVAGCLTLCAIAKGVTAL